LVNVNEGMALDFTSAEREVKLKKTMHLRALEVKKADDT